ALIDLHSLSRNLRQPLRDGVAMRRLQRQNLKNQHVERPLRDWKSRWRHKVKPDESINRAYLNLRHITVDHRRPAVKTKIQFVDSTRPPLEFNGFEKTKRADDLGLPLSTILLPPATFFFHFLLAAI